MVSQGDIRKRNLLQAKIKSVAVSVCDSLEFSKLPVMDLSCLISLFPIKYPVDISFHFSKDWLSRITIRLHKM